MIDVKMQQQLKQHFGNLVNPVVLALNLDDSNKSRELKILADQLSNVSKLIIVKQISDDRLKAPSMELIPMEQGA